MKKLARFSSLLNVAALLLALIAVFAFFSYERPQTFPNWGNIQLLFRQTTIVALASLGMTMIIISGGIDLSVGSTVALVTVVIADALKHMGPWPALLLGLGAGALAGLVNGLVITRIKVTPFIVTLGTLLVIRGIAKWMANEQKIDAPLNWLSDLIATLGPDERWKIVPIGVWLTIVLATLVSLLMRKTRFGRHIVAIGSNESAARLCGVPVERVRLAVYVLAGLFVGLAGLMQFSRLTVGDPTVATGLELDVIAAVVIGGASLSGGQGSILGSMLGALFMTTISSGCSQMGLPNYVQEIVTGVIIVGAVALDRLRVRSS